MVFHVLSSSSCGKKWIGCHGLGQALLRRASKIQYGIGIEMVQESGENSNGREGRVGAEGEGGVNEDEKTEAW